MVIIVFVQAYCKLKTSQREYNLQCGRNVFKNSWRCKKLHIYVMITAVIIIVIE